MTTKRSAGDLPYSALVPFLLITFGIAQRFGPLSGRHPLFILAVYAPAMAAFTLELAPAGLGGWV